MFEACISLAGAVRYDQVSRARIKHDREVLRLRTAHMDLPEICSLVCHNSAILFDWDVLLDKTDGMQVIGGWLCQSLCGIFLVLLC